MDNEKQRNIASKGGKAAHIKGTAHEWSSEEARAAGRKGGESRGTRDRQMIASNIPNGFHASAGNPARDENINLIGDFNAPAQNIHPGIRTDIGVH